MFDDILGESCAIFVLQCQVSGRWVMMSANLMYVLVSRRSVRVSVVWCVVKVFILFLVLRFSEMFGLPPPVWFGCLYVFMLLLVWRSEVRLKEVVLWVFGVRELCVSGSVVGRRVVPRVGAW